MNQNNSNNILKRFLKRYAGGVSFESSRTKYRGSVTIEGIRFKTSYYSTKRGAQLALTKLKKEIFTNIGLGNT